MVLVVHGSQFPRALGHVRETERALRPRERFPLTVHKLDSNVPHPVAQRIVYRPHDHRRSRAGVTPWCVKTAQRTECECRVPLLFLA